MYNKENEEKISDYRDSIYASIWFIWAFLIEWLNHESIKQYSGIILSILAGITCITTIIFLCLYLGKHSKKFNKKHDFLLRYNFWNWTLGSIWLALTFIIGGLTLDSPIFFWQPAINVNSYLPWVSWFGLILYAFSLVYCIFKINWFKK